MSLETDPDKINAMDRQLEERLFKEGESYAARSARAKTEAKGKKESRDRIKSMGMDPNAYHVAVGLIKSKTPQELKDWLRDFNLTLKVLGQKQQVLFPEEQLAAAKREADRKSRENRAPAGVPPASATDNKKRSDPNSGGAKPQTAKAKSAEDSKAPAAAMRAGAAASDAAVAEQIKATGGTAPKLRVVGSEPGQMANPPGTTASPPPVPEDDAEQAAGAKVLEGIGGKPKSQSQIAAEKQAAAMSATDLKPGEKAS